MSDAEAGVSIKDIIRTNVFNSAEVFGGNCADRQAGVLGGLHALSKHPSSIAAALRIGAVEWPNDPAQAQPPKAGVACNGDVQVS